MEATDVTNGSEKGTMTIGVACTDDGGVDTVLTIAGGANAAGSTTTIAGDLDVGGNIDVATGKTYKINNTNVLTGTSLGSGVVGSSLTSVGTLNGLTVQTSTNSADIIKLHADSGTSQTITIVNDAGTDASAISLTSTAGGVNITSAAGTAGIIKMKPGAGGLITNRPVQTVADSVNDSTAAQYVAGFINCTGGGADTWTLPTGADLADAMPSDTVTVGDSFICYVVNASGGDITYSAGASGSTISSSGAGTLVQKTASLAQLHFIFTVDTGGSEEYHCLLIADNS